MRGNKFKMKIKRVASILKIKHKEDTTNYGSRGNKSHIFCKPNMYCIYIYDGVRRVTGLRRDPAVSAEDPTYIHSSHRKTDSDPLAIVLCGILITSNGSQPAQNSYERVGVCFSVECVDRCGVYCGDCGVPK